MYVCTCMGMCTCMEVVVHGHVWELCNSRGDRKYIIDILLVKRYIYMNIWLYIEAEIDEQNY